MCVYKKSLGDLEHMFLKRSLSVKCLRRARIVNPVRPLFISIALNGKMKRLRKKRGKTCVRMFHFSQHLVDLDFVVKSFGIVYGRVAGVTRYDTDNIVKRESCSPDIVRNGLCVSLPT